MKKTITFIYLFYLLIGIGAISPSLANTDNRHIQDGTDITIEHNIYIGQALQNLPIAIPKKYKTIIIDDYIIAYKKQDDQYTKLSFNEFFTIDGKTTIKLESKSGAILFEETIKKVVIIKLDCKEQAIWTPDIRRNRTFYHSQGNGVVKNEDDWSYPVSEGIVVFDKKLKEFEVVTLRRSGSGTKGRSRKIIAGGGLYNNCKDVLIFRQKNR